MKVPEHIAVIMDGNGRWAQGRGLARIEGHKQGAKRVEEFIATAMNLKVKVVTIFAFSTENWNRPKAEIEFLFLYMRDFLQKHKENLIEKNIRFNMIGRRDRIGIETIRKGEELENLTRQNDGFIFNIALDYGGRWDIVQAAQRIIDDRDNKKIEEKPLTEDLFEKYLCLSGFPAPDLLIRTSGEQRISNFLLWQLAYAEFYFPEICWPDFDPAQLKKAIEIYGRRERRFGFAADERGLGERG